MFDARAIIPVFGLNHDPWGRLVLIDAEGVRHIGVTPVRMFPVTDPLHWISIVDAAGTEIVCIEDIGDLPPAVRQVLETDLAGREFTPVIRRIHWVSGDTEPYEWDVETDRGRTQFVLGSEDHVRRLGPHKALVVDAQGVRYLVEDTRALNTYSRRIMERYL
jgi:hypothetical protein